MKTRRLWLLGLVLLVALATGCAQTGSDEAGETSDDAGQAREAEDDSDADSDGADPADGQGETSGAGEEAELAWLDTELVDAVTGESFRISDFAGEPVLVQGFAVW
jgi:hypothetical protein